MPESITSAAERGVDISTHVARRLAAEQVREADVLIAMADEHRRVIAREVPDAASKTFTLKELVRLLEALPAPDPATPPEVGLRARVLEADSLRRAVTSRRISACGIGSDSGTRGLPLGPA